ncbi:MFS transporter [Novosphingobium sp.]|uniref:MFS transporter n=1 Tax=Novosphingobium sp. TaxID=1874826 RepID=UPI0035B0E3BF
MTVTAASAAIRRLYAHSALQSFVENSGGLFVVGFYVKQGLSYPQALLGFAAMLAVRYVMRRAILPLSLRIGLRNVMLAGIAVRTGSFALLPHVGGLDAVLLAYVMLSGLGNVFYWTGYHAFMSAVGNSAALGRQVSIQQALTAVIGIIAPLAGGFLLVSAGPSWAFLIVAGLQALAAVPMLGAPNPAVEREIASDDALLRRARWLYLAEGLQVGFGVVAWNLALFVTLDEAFDSFGGALALAGLGAAAGSLTIGHLFDRGRGHHSLPLAYGLSAITILTKSAAASTPWAAVAATALGALVAPMTATAMLLPLYTMAQRSNCVLRFTMATEGGWDLGCIIACGTTAALLELGSGFRLPILLALVGIATIAGMLSRWYARELAAA